MSVPLTRQTSAPILTAGETVVLYDGTCKLCNGWAKFLIRHDRHHRVRLATVQSPEGQALLAWAGLPRDNFNTIALIRGDRCWVRSDAFFEVVKLLPGAWPVLQLFSIVPRWLRDWLYDLIARNRYRLFGKYDACVLPAPDHPRRFLKA